DDIREAPALEIIRELTDRGADVTAFDPEAMTNTRQVIGDRVRYATNQYDALRDADALIIATEWSVFRNPDFNRMGELMGTKAIFDGRNLFTRDQMETHGFHYESIGRLAVTH
ncbi:MAG: UDP binding domain-containing protein, partial [Bacteroidota bacterium]